MLTELAPDKRASVQPLFDGFTGLRGCLHAAVEGTMGQVWADDAMRPTVARVDLDFNCLAGDATAPAAEELVRDLGPLPVFLAVSDGRWPAVLRRVFGDKVSERTRTAFEQGTWYRERLQRFVESLPADYELMRIKATDAARFAELEESLVYNFDSLDDFVARGVGFGIEHDGRFVAGCSSFAISSRSLEFEIQTHMDFRQRDLATAAAARMILHCLESGLEPCWDAHNEISAGLATKLGFVNPRPYTSYEVRA